MTEFLLILVLTVIFALFIFLMRKLGHQKTTYVAQPQQFSPKEDVTTVLPVSIHAATCDHDWEIITEQTLEMPHEKKIVLVMACRHCGTVDKTVQITSPPPPEQPPPPCLHDWQTVVEQNLDVAHEKKVIVILTCRKCGQIDKTTEVTSPMPKKELLKSECRHKWETEKRVVLDSAYEQMLKSISTKQPYGKAKVDADKQIDLDLNNAPSWMFRKAYVCVRICSICGEIDKIITSNLGSVDDTEEDWPETTPIKIKA